MAFLTSDQGMTASTIGVDVADLGLPVKEALRKAAELAFRVVEVPTVAGDLAPANLSASGRRHLLRYADGLGLRIAALAADIPGLHLTEPQTVGERVARTCQIIALATDLGVPVVTASVGAVTHPDTGEPSALAVEALREIGEFADYHSIIYAMRPSYENEERLARIFDEVRCPSIGVGHDPAALLMAGVNPISIIGRFADQIPLVHVRDGTVGGSNRAGQETRLGEGDVDLASVLAALHAADYCGPYVVRRTDSQSPIVDIKQGRNVLADMLRAR